MKSRLLTFGLPGLASFVLAFSFHSLPLCAGEPRTAEPAAGRSNPYAAETAGRSKPYDIEIVNGRLLLANLKGRVNVEAIAKAGDSTDATMSVLLDVLRELHPNTDIVAAPGIEKIRISNLKLRSGQLQTELVALRVASEGRFDFSGPDFAPSLVDPATGAPVRALYILNPNVPAQANRGVEVFNIGPYLQQFGGDKKDTAENLEKIQRMIIDVVRELTRDPDSEPSFQFHPGANLLVVIGVPEALDASRKVIGALLTPNSAAVPFGGYPASAAGFASAGFAGSPNAPNPFGPAMSKSRRLLLDKLESIRLETVMYDGLPLSEVISGLASEAKKRDPDKRGVNFIIPQASTVVVAGAVDPTTGLPVAPKEVLDLGSVTIRIKPALNNVRMVDVLDAIVKVADHPIRYSIEDYAVVFSMKETADPTRPNPFEAAPGVLRRY